MKRTIWKLPLKIADGVQTIDVDDMSVERVVHIGEQDGELCVWVEVNDSPWARGPLRLEVIGTGHPWPSNASHLASVVMSYGLVWHVMEYPR